MKKTMTRILALVLAVLMVGSLLPVFASAQESQATDPAPTTAPTTAPTDPPETTAATTAPTDPVETTAPEETTAPTQPQVYSVCCYAPDGVTLVATVPAQAGSPVTLPASFEYDGDTYTVTAWVSADGSISGLTIPAMPEGDVALTAQVQAHVPGEIDDPAASAVYELTLTCNNGCDYNGKTLINNGLDRKDFTIQSVEDFGSDAKEVSLTIPEHTTSAGPIVFARSQQANVYIYKGSATAAHTPAAPTSFQLEIDCDGKNTGCCGHQAVTVTDFTLTENLSWWPDTSVKWRWKVTISGDALKTAIRNSLDCDESLKDAYAENHALRDDKGSYNGVYGVYLTWNGEKWVAYQDTASWPDNLPLTYTAPTAYTLVIDPGTTDAVTGMPGNKTLTPVNGQATIAWAELTQGNPQRAGYYFMGWAIDSGSITETQTTSGSYFTLTGHAVLKALWSAEHKLTLKAEWDDENHPLRPTSVNFQLKDKDMGLVLDSGVLTRDGGWTYTITVPQDALAYLQYVQEAPQGYTVTQTAETVGNATTITFRNTRNKTVYVYSDEIILKTGQTTWPIPLLALAGLVCLSAGAFLLPNQRKGRR